jgi:hypothetical protein
MKIRVSFLPLLLLSFLFLVSSSRAAGLIGQTYDVCVTQLGEPTKHVETGSKPVTDLWTFTQGDWNIEIGLWKGVVQMVTYHRVDGKPLEPAQIQALLIGFGDKLAWTKDAKGNFRRSDQVIKATMTQKGGLTFLTTDLARSL